MKILLTGGTGFIGKKLCLKLFQENHQLVLLTRNAKKAARSFELPVEFYPWDPDRGFIPKEAFENVDAVIHLAGESISEGRWTEEKKSKIGNSRIQSTIQLRNKIISLPQLPKVVISASAVGIYGNRGDEILNESSLPGSSFLAKVCKEWEHNLLEAEWKGIRCAAIRIGIVLGNDGGAFKKMLPLFSKGLGARLGSGKQWMSWIHIDDLTSLISFLLKHDSAQGAFNAVAPSPITNSEFTRSFAKKLRRPALATAPDWILKPILGEMSQAILDSQRAIPEKALNLGFHFQYPSLESALEDLCSYFPHQKFEAFQFVNQPVETIFPFFSQAENLETLTPPWLKFKVIGKSTPQIQEGTIIDYRLKLHGIPIQWQSRIENWTPNQGFVDTQTKGPYKFWHHTHRFQGVGQGTLMSDRVIYRLPGKFLGNGLMGDFVQKDIKKIFAYRRKKIEELFEKSSGN